MPIIDPGVTTFDETGRPTLSPNAIRLPPDISRVIGAVAPNSAPLPSGINPSMLEKPPNIQPQQQLSSPLPQNNLPAPTPQSLGQNNLPKISPSDTQFASDSYKDIVAHPLNRADYEPQGIRRVLNHIAGPLLGMGEGYRGEPITGFQGLQSRTYNQAESDRQNRLKELDPAMKFEESQTKERGESERSAASLASSDAYRKAVEAHQKAIEEETDRQREETERKDAAAEEIKRQELVRQKRRDELTEAIRKANEARLEKQNTVRDTETARHNKVDEDIARNRSRGENEGSWQPMEDEEGKLTKQYNPKTGEVRDAPSSMAQVHKPGTFAKKDAKLEPMRAAQSFADDYLKSGQYDGPHDEALLEKYFELAKPSSGFRMTKPQMDMLLKSRGIIEGMKARGEHLVDGSYFDPEQRKQIVKTMRDLATASGALPKVSAPESNITIHWPGEK